MDLKVGPEHFKGEMSCVGELEVTVSLGGLTVSFEGLTRELRDDSLDRYRPFLSAGPAQHRVTLRRGEASYLAPSPDGYLRLEETSYPSGKVLLSTDFAAFHPSSSEKGLLRISDPADVKRSVRALENYLRWTVADLAIRSGAFVLHSAGLVREGRAYLFFGHSGAGKSTVTALSSGLQILSDDLVLVRRGSGGFEALTTPFWGAFAQESKETGIFPVAGLYRLVQSKEVKLVPLPPALAVGKIISACPFVSDPARRTEGLLPLVEDLCRTVPAHDLHFRKEPSFWGVILESEGSNG